MFIYVALRLLPDQSLHIVEDRLVESLARPQAGKRPGNQAATNTHRYPLTGILRVALWQGCDRDLREAHWLPAVSNRSTDTGSAGLGVHLKPLERASKTHQQAEQFRG